MGEFKVSVDVKEGRIRNISLAGDFFITGDIDTMLLSRLKGLPYNRESIAAAVDAIDTTQVIMNLQKEQLINLIL